MRRSGRRGARCRCSGGGTLAATLLLSALPTASVTRSARPKLGAAWFGPGWPEAKALCLSQLGLDLLIAEQVRFYHQIAGSEKLFAASPSIGIPDLCPFHRQLRPCLISTNIQRRSSHATTT
ncbi:hypothetical protein PaG_04548 [Moesziomyces aphidis]|uniref:Uncharacterized protein n=1 Tax=Moesziomyces aphidis TaxID=84754 RepID=W3VIL6_MOEAP|nr:hypothetical protein PaG_04548 [Moesziomyces aphidis]